MPIKPFFQNLISLPVFALMLTLASATDALATPAYMQQYGAPTCQTCHYDNSVSSGKAGLAAYLASKTPTCSAPQVLQNNVCVTPVPTCTAPQVLQNNVCVTPPPTCIAPQVLQDNVCVTPIPTCIAPQALQNNVCVTPPPAQTMVRMQTSLGLIDIRLFDADAPLTVANFLSYIDSGAYNSSLIHRSTPGFSVQGGGYVWNSKSKSAKTIAKKAPVVNEFSPSHSNLRGTVAMVKMSGKPDSATTQWSFNLADNSANLDYQNGGSTVFGQIVEKSMAVVDAIAALPRKNAGGALTQLPIATTLTGPALKALLKKPLAKNNLVTINSVSSTHANIAPSDADRVFAYLEAAYPDQLAPANPLSPSDAGSVSSGGYYYRYYATTQIYVFTSNGGVYFRGPVSNDKDVFWGSLSDFLALAVAAGY